MIFSGQEPHTVIRAIQVNCFGMGYSRKKIGGEGFEDILV